MKFQRHRYFHSTYLLLEGVHPKIVSEWLGHSTPTMQAGAVLAYDAAEHGEGAREDDPGVS